MRTFLSASLVALLIAACAATTPEGSVQVTGVVTTEGVECPAVRGDDGKLYTLAGAQDLPPAGTRVRITGQVAEISTCMQGTTIAVTTLDRM
jgi:cytochrome c1